MWRYVDTDAGNIRVLVHTMFAIEIPHRHLSIITFLCLDISSADHVFARCLNSVRSSPMLRLPMTGCDLGVTWEYRKLKGGKPNIQRVNIITRKWDIKEQLLLINQTVVKIITTDATTLSKENFEYIFYLIQVTLQRYFHLKYLTNQSVSYEPHA